MSCFGNVDITGSCLDFFNNVHGRFSSVFARFSVTDSDVAGSLHVILYYPHSSYRLNMGPEVQEVGVYVKEVAYFIDDSQYNSRTMGRGGAKSKLKLPQE